MSHRKLGRTSSHRAALFRNQLASMIQSERIITTLAKAKELRPILEKMITLGKTDSVHARRQAARSISDDALVQKLFADISPRFASRPGGYTRIIKLGPRRGDGAEMAILELVDFEFVAGKAEAPTKKKPARKAAAAPKADKQAESASGEAEETPEKAPKKKPAAKKAAPRKGAKKPAPKKPASKKPAGKSGAKKSSKRGG
ncbi:MAG TPA: 50S ribosomal protein L17 [Thermoanaerobaculia bacterium]|nr:50S ribosomal protein L17 [Thermoanaerobaculia bacterium]